MKYRSATARLWLTGALFLALLAPAFHRQPKAQTPDDAARPVTRTKPGPTNAQLTREAELWHELNRQRVEATQGVPGVAAFTANIVSQDAADIALIQSDSRLRRPVFKISNTG